MLPPEQRRALLVVTAKTATELRKAWRRVDFATPYTAKTDLLDLVPPLGDSYRLAAAALAADWYDSLREERGAAGRFVAEPAKLANLSRFEALVGWGIGPLFGSNPDPYAALSKIDGGLQRIVADGYRETVQESSVRDRAAQGWAREGVGDCDFCRMLIGRGAVYTEATADFESHDRCHCVAVPVFD